MMRALDRVKSNFPGASDASWIPTVGPAPHWQCPGLGGKRQPLIRLSRCHVMMTDTRAVLPKEISAQQTGLKMGKRTKEDWIQESKDLASRALGWEVVRAGGGSKPWSAGHISFFSSSPSLLDKNEECPARDQNVPKYGL